MGMRTTSSAAVMVRWDSPSPSVPRTTATPEAGAGPDRKRYEITAAGRGAVEEWIRSPQVPTDSIQADLFAKTIIALLLDEDGQIRVLGERLGFMGVKINQEVNETRSDEPRVISTPDSKVTVLVVPTNEELAIARQALTLI